MKDPVATRLSLEELMLRSRELSFSDMVSCSVMQVSQLLYRDSSVFISPIVASLILKIKIKV